MLWVIMNKPSQVEASVMSYGHNLTVLALNNFKNV